MRDIDSKLNVFESDIFRSLLERKWALFFKYLGISFKYEPERFSDGTTIGYLPDFLIYGKLYLEIKPTIEIAMNELKKPHGFVKETGSKLLIVIGDPPGTKMLAVVKREDGEIEHNDVSWIAWNTMDKRTKLDESREIAAVNYVNGEVDNKMTTHIARGLDKINRLDILRNRNA